MKQRDYTVVYSYGDSEATIHYRGHTFKMQTPDGKLRHRDIDIILCGIDRRIRGERLGKAVGKAYMNYGVWLIFAVLLMVFCAATSIGAITALVMALCHNPWWHLVAAIAGFSFVAMVVVILIAIWLLRDKRVP